MSSSTSDLPTVGQLRKIMRDLSDELYEAWKVELGKRISDLEFEGYLAKDHLNVSSAVWRLPNDSVRRSLCKLQDDLDVRGFEYDFRFDYMDDTEWVLWYAIELPERDEMSSSDSEDDEEEDVPLLDLSTDDVYNKHDGVINIDQLAPDLEKLKLRVPKEWQECRDSDSSSVADMLPDVSVQPNLTDARNRVIFLDS